MAGDETTAMKTKDDDQGLRTGRGMFSQQCKALLMKNFLLSRRNLRATGIH